MSSKIFKKRYKHKPKFINACILRIRYGNRSEKTIRGYKTFIFKSMRMIVEKNIGNAVNLLRSTGCRELPTQEEFISDCWVVFDKCIERYIVSRTNSFYFYYNTALSRKFFQDYKDRKDVTHVELSEVIKSVHPQLSYSSHSYTVEILFDNMNLTELQKEICRSKMKGEKAADFIKRNEGITIKQYQQELYSVKDIIRNLQEDKKF